MVSLIGESGDSMRRKIRDYPQGALERVQRLDLSILSAFDTICRDNGLTYFADGGTCLGAVRHKGFIPWDDDVDVGMPIDDYQEFLRIAPHALPSNMSIHTRENTSGFAYLWAKIFINGTKFYDMGAVESGCDQGIFIDIFPYIPISAPEANAVKYLRKTQNWTKVYYLRHMSYSIIPYGAAYRTVKVAACRLAHALISRMMTDEYVWNRYLASFPQHQKDEIWANPSASKPYPFLRDWLFQPKESKFEDMSIFIPRNADAYLRMLYGDDYMIPPSPEKRKTHTPETLDFGDGVDIMNQLR